MLFWILICVAGLAGLILCFAVVGTFLPERYQAKGRMQMPISADELWRRMHDPEAFPMSGKMCKSVELLPDENGRAVWVEDMGHTQLRICDGDATEPTHLCRTLTDSVVPFTAETEFVIEPGAGTESCTVTCTNVSVIRSGTWHVPFFRVMIGLFGGAKSGCKDYLTRVSGGAGRIKWLPVRT